MNSRLSVKSQSILIFLLWVAFTLRIYQLASIPTYLDEYHTIANYVPLSALDIFQDNFSNNHPMASFLAHSFSPSANNYFLMRWPMVLIGMLTLPFVYRLGIALFDRYIALTALFLIIVSPHHLAFSTSVRGYGGLILGVTASSYLLIKALKRNQWQYWSGYILFNLISIYFHLFAVLAISTQLMLAWGYIITQRLPQFKWLGLKIGAITVLFGLVTLLLITQVQSILSEGGDVAYSNNDFGVWHNGLNGLEDIQPFNVLFGLFGPMSPFGWETYIYLGLAFIGIVILSTQRLGLATIGIIWFITPLGLIFVAIQFIGLAFYAYARFLIYLLPGYLLLVAFGTNQLYRNSRFDNIKVKHAIKIIIIGSLTLISLMSIYGYFLRATHADWHGVTKILSQELAPSDITICQKYNNGFAGPESKTGQPYCMWMLSVPLEQLTAYTPHFEDTTDVIANATYFHDNRVILNQPGTVWLVLWHKLSYSPHGMLTSAKWPHLPQLSPLSDFTPYQAYRLGTITVVHVDTEQTLLANIEQALMLLLELESNPADQARYYRSLAELEAVQGHRNQAEQFFELSWENAERANQYPDLFLLETKPVIERLPHPKTDIDINTIDYRIDETLCLSAYDISLTSANILSLTLVWQTNDFVETDYGYFLSFENEQGESIGQLEFQPFDRIYPTNWWWTGQTVTETREIVIPPDLPKQSYLIRVGSYDYQNPESFTTLDSKPLFMLQYGNNWHIEPVETDSVDCP